MTGVAIVHEIQIDGYCARFSGVGARLQLGTYGSYGIEQLHIELGESWQGLVVYANFVTADGTTPVIVPESGLVDVPPEATAKPGTGNIVLDGTADGVRIYSVDIPYLMLKHSALTGEAPAPTPDRWEQFVAEVKQYSDAAAESADKAEESSGKAEEMAAAAASSASDSAQSAQAAATSAAEAAQSAAAEVVKVQSAGTSAVQAVQQAQSTATKAVSDAQQSATQAVSEAQVTAVSAVHAVGTAQTNAVASAASSALTGISGANDAALSDVAEAGTAQVSAVRTAGTSAVQDVNDAKTAALEAIDAANAALPSPTQSDVGKVPTVKADGSTYELAGPYAPLSAAIRPTASGIPVSITDSVEWLLLGLKVYGKSTQDGKPSPDNPVPVVSAGENGSITVTVSDGVDQSQQLSIQTPNGLPGIPVDSAGNYTDAKGQQLTCNYRDYNSEKDFQWIGKTVVDGSTIKFVVKSTLFNLPYDSSPKIARNARFLCNYFPGNIFASNANYDFAFCRVERMKDFGISSDDEFNQLCQQWNSSGNPLTIYYTMDEPIESPIPTEELAAYRTLHAYDGTTVVSTAEDVAGLVVRYVADAQKYIDNKIQSALAPVNQAILEAKTNV